MKVLVSSSMVRYSYAQEVTSRFFLIFQLVIEEKIAKCKVIYLSIITADQAV
jgi:hypothetical protein